MTLTHAWHYSATTAAQSSKVDSLIAKIESSLGPEVDAIDLGKENGIPVMELVSEKVLTFEKATRLAKLVQAVCECPVHFYQLQAHAVVFFVFSEVMRTGPYTSAQLAEFGVPVDDWLKAVISKA